ncbi:MAG: shikimate dehydrogenase [Gammaproteobacteria bacterium]|nr:MAG: shikimate dehydrogenase [Gammaproteobacteria bacterium]
MTDRYAVMGHPIAHSLSPRIHAAFAQQTGQDLVYEAIDVPPGAFAEAVARFRAEGGQGLNVTVPHKEAAYRLARRHRPRAEEAGAANTLWWEGESLVADNTDGVGLVRDLTDNLGFAPAGRRILLVGAGGAAQGVVGPLLDLRPAALHIVNRTVARAEHLAARFASRGLPITAGGFDTLAGAPPWDLVVHATAAGLEGAVPPLPPSVIGPQTLAYDMMYRRDGETPFVRWARDQGAARAVDGLGMLVEQAAEAFFLWRGVRPRTRPVLEGLRPPS